MPVGVPTSYTNACGDGPAAADNLPIGTPRGVAGGARTGGSGARQGQEVTGADHGAAAPVPVMRLPRPAV